MAFKRRFESRYTNDYTQPTNPSVQGFLLFFLISIALGAIYSVISDLRGISFNNDQAVGWILYFIYTGNVVTLLYDIGLLCLSSYTIYSFIQLKPNAVFLGKSYLVITFFVILSSLLFDKIDIKMIVRLARTLFICAVWFFYLSYSVQINRLFPKEERKIFKRDRYLLCIMLTPLIVWLISVAIYNYVYTINAKPITIESMSQGHRYDVHQTE